MDGQQHKLYPNFFRAKRDPGVAGNFVIQYEVLSDRVTVTRVGLNKQALVPQERMRDERAALYRVERNAALNFHHDMTLDDVKSLTQAWNLKLPVTQVKTRHAAVNGMLNDLTKATWLMGTHIGVAFATDQVNEYTLFHNPSETPLLDFYESVRDNLGITTENARHFAAVLADVQKQGQPVKWVVHSQGGIIFKQAVAYHIKTQGPNASLNKNSVVFHAGGNNAVETLKLLTQVGIAKLAPDRNNPFDLVPALAGRNNLSPAIWKRVLQFWGKVKGTPGSSPAESPHTLPYIGLEAYQRFLLMAGDTKSASRVEKLRNKQLVA